MKAADQYNALDRLLSDYGLDRIDSATFWRRMEQNKFGQPHIDWFLEQQRKRDEKPVLGPVRLVLSARWKDKAVSVGKQRHAFAESRGWVNYGAQQARESYDINGAVAECGVAKHFKQKWRESVGILDGIDVGEIIEVRGRAPGSDLGIRPKDKRELPHVLVWVYGDYSMQLLGWLYGHEGMHTEQSPLWSGSSGCWYNPPPYRPLDELARILADADEVGRILQRHLASERKTT